MNWLEVQERLNKIIQIDVMADDEWNFMATHMPFSRLSVQYAGERGVASEYMNEEEVYRKLLLNPNNEHRMIVVTGPNGAGKSHLIRRLRARMLSDSSLHRNEKVVFIRRVDNTLRGTMRQLLEQGVVSDANQQDRIRQFIKSSHVQNEQELKSTLYYAFLTKVETEEEETHYRQAERKRVAAFLSDNHVKEFLMREGGAISRFYTLIAKPHGVTQRVEAQFRPEDFTSMSSIKSLVQKDGSHEAKLMLGRVIIPREAEKLSRYLNQFSNAVIQQCANIFQGDIEEIFRQLRYNLQQEGKSLTVFIEDMTTFTGLDTELIKILSVPHEGEYKDLCRVTSVIGLTDAYYDAHFRGNFQNRVTHQIKLDETSFGNAESLAQMAARYINAAYMTEQVVKDWYNNGANPDSLPYRTYEPDWPWERVKVGEREFSLFPFNRRALVNLFNRLHEKTPRIFLRDVVKVQLNAWINHQLDQGVFPDTRVSAIGEEPVQFAEAQHAARFETLNLPLERKGALRALLCLWGTATLYEEGEGKEKKVADLPLPFLEMLGFPSVQGVTGRAAQPTPSKPLSHQPSGEAFSKKAQDPAEKRLKEQLFALDNWYQNRKALEFPDDFRTRVRDFLRDTISWQTEGVPAYLAADKLRDARCIYIEDLQVRTDSSHHALISIPRSDSSYWMLKALTHWELQGIKSWDFKDAPFLQYKLITWLEKNKAEILAKVKGEPFSSPYVRLQWAMALEYLFLGIRGQLSGAEDDNTLLSKLFRPDSGAVLDAAGRDEGWQQLLTYIQNRKNLMETNKTILHRFPNTHLGDINRERESKYFFHRDQIDHAFAILKKFDWDVAPLLPEQVPEQEGGRDFSTFIVKELKALLPKVKEVLEAEKKKTSQLLAKLEEELGEKLDRDTWLRAAQGMSNFLLDINSKYNIHYRPQLRTAAEQMEEGADEWARRCQRAKEVLASNRFSEQLAFFSSNPCAPLLKFLQAMDEVKALAEKEAEKARQKMAELQPEYSVDGQGIENLKAQLKSLRGRITAWGGTADANRET